MTGPKVVNGNDVWVITDHFNSMEQYGQEIKQATGGGSSYTPVGMKVMGPPWATTYEISDPDGNTGNSYQWNWLTTALHKAHSGVSTEWQSSSGGTDTFSLPWRVPSQIHAKQYKGYIPSNVAQVSYSDIGIHWVAPKFIINATPVLSAHSSIRGTWEMLFSKNDWNMLKLWNKQEATKKYLKSLDPRGVWRTVKGGGVEWVAPVVLNSKTKNTMGLGNWYTHVNSTTFWTKSWVGGWNFVPSSSWVVPANWSYVGVNPVSKWNNWVGPVDWTFDWHLPFGGHFVPAEWGGTKITEPKAPLWNNAPQWNTQANWVSIRWGHVALALAGLLAVLAGVIVAVKKGLFKAKTKVFQAGSTFCTHCGSKIDPGEKFCPKCGQPRS